MTSLPFLQHAFGPVYSSLQGLDSFFHSAGSSKGSLTWSRVWEKTSSQALEVRKMLNEIVDQSPRSVFNGKHIETIKLSCSEPSSGEILSSLTNNDLQTCKLDLIPKSGAPLSENVADILSKSDQNGPDNFGLNRLLKLLTTGEGSEESTKELLQSNSYRSLTNQLGYQEMQESRLGGTFSSTYTSSLQVKLKDVFSFFFPNTSAEEAATKGDDWVNLDTTCRVFSKESNGMVCLHTLKDVSGNSLKTLRVENFQDSKAIYANQEVADSWAHALKGNNLISSYSISKAPGDLNKESKLTLYPDLWSLLPSFKSLKAPSANSWLPLLLVPAGLGLSLAGVIYTKNSYQDESKSKLRKAVALTTGVATTVLGLALIVTPFGAFSN